MRVAQCTLLSLVLASSTLRADWTLNMTPGVTPISHDIYDLHMTIFWICVAIGVVVFGTMLYAIIYHRKSLGKKAAQFHEHLWVEVTWTIIPFLILVAMAIPATKVLIHLRDTSKSDITIKVTGFQWKWHYEYLESGVSFFSNSTTPFEQIHNQAPKDVNYLRTVDHPLVLPVHKKVRLLITSNDVIHSWWVPDLGTKQDAIPGFINEAWTRINRAGTYHGQCAELCGINHAYMPIVVEAMGDKDFASWLEQQKSGGSAPGPTPTAVTATTVTPAPTKPLTNAPPALPTAEPAPPPTDTSATATATVKAGTVTATTTSGTASVTISAGSTTATATVKPSSKQIKTPVAKEATPMVPASTTPSKPPATQTPTAAPPIKPIASAPVTPAKPTPPPATAAPQKFTLQQQMQQGEKIFNGTCATCHQATGEGMPPLYPALKGSKITTGPLPNHMSRVLFGKPGTAMQAFKDQFSDEELAGVITYERNSWGNNKGDVVQPEDIKAAKAKGALPE